MYQFETPAIGLSVHLHDEEGGLIGVALFHQGQWRTDSKAEAEAMFRAAVADDVKNYRIVCVAKPEPEQDEAATEDTAKPGEPGSKKGK